MKFCYVYSLLCTDNLRDRIDRHSKGYIGSTKVRQLALKWLNRRSDRKSFNWEEFEEHITNNPLPLPKLTYAIYNTW